MLCNLRFLCWLFPGHRAILCKTWMWGTSGLKKDSVNLAPAYPGLSCTVSRTTFSAGLLSCACRHRGRVHPSSTSRCRTSVSYMYVQSPSPRTKNVHGGDSYSLEWLPERWLVLSLIYLDFPHFHLLWSFIMPTLLSAGLLKMRVKFLCELSFKWEFKIKKKCDCLIFIPSSL